MKPTGLKVKIESFVRHWSHWFLKNQMGSLLIESVIAVGIVGAILSVSINVLATGSKAVGTVEVLTTAQGIARSQVEYVRGIAYCPPPCSYPTISVAPPYSVTAEAETYLETETDLEYVVVTVYKEGVAVAKIKEIRVNR